MPLAYTDALATVFKTHCGATEAPQYKSFYTQSSHFHVHTELHSDWLSSIKSFLQL